MALVFSDDDQLKHNMREEFGSLSRSKGLYATRVERGT
jgi:hypothetical protein